MGEEEAHSQRIVLTRRDVAGGEAGRMAVYYDTDGKVQYRQALSPRLVSAEALDRKGYDDVWFVRDGLLARQKTEDGLDGKEAGIVFGSSFESRSVLKDKGWDVRDLGTDDPNKLNLELSPDSVDFIHVIGTGIAGGDGDDKGVAPYFHKQIAQQCQNTLTSGGALIFDCEVRGIVGGQPDRMAFAESLSDLGYRVSVVAGSKETVDEKDGQATRQVIRYVARNLPLPPIPDNFEDKTVGGDTTPLRPQTSTTL